ncbi:hypothetical protein FHL15_008914 [Xylaria flabelliformis]|uniref:Uncharacterized protein n=1 Tax=Xylaria flabelliformis TaxID=2512241 RepID=A0A553HQE6_9PEZI|nr:hypothetical protein FHL15_008914 [Xylaria flabelliformis]
MRAPHHSFVSADTPEKGTAIEKGFVLVGSALQRRVSEQPNPVHLWDKDCSFASALGRRFFTSSEIRQSLKLVLSLAIYLKMFDMAELTRPGPGHRPSALTISTKTHCHPDSDLESRQARKSSKVRLAKPLSERKRRRIIKNTTRLIKRRNRLNRQILREVKKKNSDFDDDCLLRDKLRTKREILSKRERLHLKKRTRKLAKLKALWQRDPSSTRYNDYNLVRELFQRFERNLGPLLQEYTNRHTKKDDGNDRMSPSDSKSGSEWINTSESEDEQPHPSHAQNKNAAKDTKKGASLSPQTNRKKRKYEEEHTESKSSKRDVALDHGKNYEGLKSEDALISSRSGTPLGRGVLDTGGVSAVDSSFDRRRLDKMIEETFNNFDTLVYNTPNPPLGLRKKKHVYSGNPYDMSGALSIDPGPSQVKGDQSIATPTGETKIDLMNYCEPTKHSNSISAPGSHSEEETSGVDQFGFGSEQAQAGRNQNQYMTSPPDYSLRGVSTLFDSFLSRSNEDDGNPLGNGARLSSYQTRRKTPIPAPQPWTGLGISNPFTDHLPHTPPNRGRPGFLETASAPQMEGNALSLSETQVDGRRVSMSGFPRPDSSPLKGFPRSETDRKRHHKQKHGKKHSSDPATYTE